MPKRARVQTWPIKFVGQATIIKSQNELLLLDLLMSHQELKINNPGKLEEVLPSLKQRVITIYQAACKVKGQFSHAPPTWFGVSQDIKEDYPETYTDIAALGRKLRSKKIDEARKDLIVIINTVAGIHADILRIPIPEGASAGAFILDVNNLNLIRNHTEFKLPDS